MLRENSNFDLILAKVTTYSLESKLLPSFFRKKQQDAIENVKRFPYGLFPPTSMHMRHVLFLPKHGVLHTHLAQIIHIELDFILVVPTNRQRAAKRYNTGN